MGFPGTDKLTINKQMKDSWLIQRLKKPYGGKIDNLFSFGGGLQNGGLSSKAMDLIRGIFAFDYMGSSEFEWGAVPQALRFLAEQAGKTNLIADKVEVGKTETVYYICPLEYTDEVITRIKQLRQDEYKLQLKEHCGLKDYFEGSPFYKPKKGERDFTKDNCGWLELDNGFAFFTDKEMFGKFVVLFGIKV